MTKLSVIIPVYNTEQYLEQCLESILNQTLNDIEIICINDGSTDGSLKILERYASKDPRIKIINTKNKGAGNARNEGKKAACGEYLHFMDSDDYLFNLEAYEKIYNAAKNNEYPDVIRFKASRTDVKTGKENCNPYSLKPSLCNRYLETAAHLNEIIETGVPPWLGFIKRDFAVSNSIAFNTLRCCNDRSFFIESILLAKKVYMADETVAVHRINNPKSLVGIRDRSFECHFESMRLIQKFSKEQNINKKLSKTVILNELFDMFYYFEKYLFNSKYSYKIFKSTVHFLKELNLKELNPEIQKMHYYNRFLTLRNLKPEKIPFAYSMLYGKYALKNLINIIKPIGGGEPYRLLRCLSCIPKLHIKEHNMNAKIEDLEYRLRSEYEFKLREYMHPDMYPKYLKNWYFEKTGKVLNLENPKNFNDKINWLKLYDSTPLKTRLTDKYLVRDWIKEKIGEEYLIPLLGVWDNFDDIDFASLPDKFVLKCNHGSSYNIIVTDKDNLNYNEIRNKINGWMKKDFAFANGIELHYSGIERKITAEKYLETENNDLQDYKFLCFNGKPEYVWVDSGRHTEHKRNLYDIEWNLLKEKISEGEKDFCYENFFPCDKPFNFEKMKEFTSILSDGFSFVRVDFYEHNKKLYFGEMTFTSASGAHTFFPEEFGDKLGSLINLENLKERK